MRLVIHEQILDEEKENLRKLEERVKNLAEEAAHAAEMEASLADADGVTGVEGAAAAATALRERQKDAEEKLARLQKAIEGPPQLEVRFMTCTNFSQYLCQHLRRA